MTRKVVVAAALVGLAAFAGHAQQPSFRTGVELVSLNVTVTEATRAT
jgi:hypothetical protein